MRLIRLATACVLTVSAAASAAAQERAAAESTDIQTAKNAIVSLHSATDAPANRWDLRGNGSDRRVLGRWTNGEAPQQTVGGPSSQAITGVIVNGAESPLIVTVLGRAARESHSLRVVTETGLPQTASVIAWDSASDLAVLTLGNGDKSTDQLSNGQLSALPLSSEPAAWGAPIRVLSQWRPGNPAMLAGIVATSTSYEKGVGTEIFHTDVVVPQGARGGPVLNSAGRVVGIITGLQNISSGVGAGTAIGLEPIRRLIDFVQAGGQGALPRSRLGVGLESTDDGVIVRSAMPDSPAQQAGVEAGDRIVAVDGSRVRSPEDLMGAVVARRPGDALELTIQRAGQQMQLTATLDQMQPEPAAPGPTPPVESSGANPSKAPLDANVPLNAETLREQLEDQLLYRSPVRDLYPPAVGLSNPALDDQLRSQLESINEQLRLLREQLQQSQKPMPQQP